MMYVCMLAGTAVEKSRRDLDYNLGARGVIFHCIVNARSLADTRALAACGNRVRINWPKRKAPIPTGTRHSNYRAIAQHSGA